MKKLLRWLSPSKTITPISPQICHHNRSTIPLDQINKSLIFLSKDYCKTCNQNVCHVCSDNHIVQHCKVSLGVNRDFGNGKERLFNMGYLTKLNLHGVKCICGKPLIFHHPNHAICAACGLASCSDQCHHQWEKIGNCTYNKNFFQPDTKLNLRSIRLSNILNIQNSKIKRWNLAQKTSLSFISCYASKVTDFILLQRGYRNYGRPQPQLIQRLQPQSFSLDFTTHIQRICTCQCASCFQRQVHSVGNCQYQCQKSVAEQVDSHGLKEEFHKQCKCTCEFCAKGTVVDSHRRLDCIEHCYKSQLNLNTQF